MLSTLSLVTCSVSFLLHIFSRCRSYLPIEFLDFSKLERDNVESDARPVLVEPRKMLESVARMAGGAIDVDQDDNVVENIISVAPEVPTSIYIDETYALRVCGFPNTLGFRLT
jgi:hypothetical protein